MLVEYRDSILGPPPNLGDIRLLWTDIPYGTGKTMSSNLAQYKDYSDTKYVLEAIKKWLPAIADNGTVVICCDYRMTNKIINIFKKNCWHYYGEIIWTFGLGRPRTTWWPVRHNNLLTFSRYEGSALFDSSAVPREKRLAPKSGYSDDKPAGSVWEFTMSNTHPERVGYPNQKPLEIIEPFILAHTNPNDLVVDIFCGSSSTGVAALKHNRDYYGCDNNPSAIEISRKRLGFG